MTERWARTQGSWVVLLKGANVGGNTFRPSQLVKELPEFGLRSVGAAGTFVARTIEGAAVVRETIRARLPFRSPIMVLRGDELSRILRADPIRGLGAAPGVRRFATIADEPLSRTVPLPIEVPGPKDWEVRVLAIDGTVAMGVRRRLGARLIYPNEVVERAFGVEATTRWWETLQAVGRLIEAPAVSTGAGGAGG